jgi:hypothetical protein
MHRMGPKKLPYTNQTNQERIESWKIGQSGAAVLFVKA